MTAPPTPRERWIHLAFWLRWAIAAAVIALLIALWFIPQPRRHATDQGPALRVSHQLRGIATAISEYAKAHDGQLPPPDQLVQSLSGTGQVAPEHFTLREAKNNEPSFFFIAPESRGTIKPRPVLFTNPTLFKHGLVYVHFEDDHSELLTGPANQAFLTFHAPHAIPLK